MTIQSFIKKNRIAFEAEEIGSRPDGNSDWVAGSRHYRCKLRCGRKSMTVYFSQGPAIEREPTAADVLDCLASDVGGIESARSFEEWAGDLGFDPDSRTAERIFKAVKAQAARLESVLGREHLELLCFETERL